jgi:acetoin utilization deacetylase AcuC-like enzyme
MPISYANKIKEALTIQFLSFSVVEPRPATFDELCVFHSADYLEFLKKISGQDDDEKHEEEALQYGLSMCLSYSCSLL